MSHAYQTIKSLLAYPLARSAASKPFELPPLSVFPSAVSKDSFSGAVTMPT